MSGFGEGMRLTREEVEEVKLVDTVYRALVRQVYPEVGTRYEEVKRVVLWIEVRHQLGGCDSVKRLREFEGPGGREVYWRCIGLLLLQGRVEGHAGRGPREGGWRGRALGLWASRLSDVWVRYRLDEPHMV